MIEQQHNYQLKFSYINRMMNDVKSFAIKENVKCSLSIIFLESYDHLE